MRMGSRRLIGDNLRRNIFEMEAEDRRQEAFWATVKKRHERPYTHKGHIDGPAREHVDREQHNQ